MPQVHIQWHDVWIGAAVTALLFNVGKIAIGLYIGKSAVTSGFGAAGSLAVILLWVYYSAQVFLLGAEFTWAFAHAYGSRRDQPVPDVAGSAPGVPQKPGRAAATDTAQAPRGGRLAQVLAAVRRPAMCFVGSAAVGVAAVLAFSAVAQRRHRRSPLHPAR